MALHVLLLFPPVVSELFFRVLMNSFLFVKEIPIIAKIFFIFFSLIP